MASTRNAPEQTQQLIWQLKLQSDRHGSVHSTKLRDLLADPAKLTALLDEAEASGDPERMRLARLIRPQPDDRPSTAAGMSVGSSLNWAAVAGVALVVAILAWFFTRPAATPGTAETAGFRPALQKDAAADTDSKAAASRTIFRLHGSNTVGEELAPALLERWMKAQGADQTRVDDTDVVGERVVSGDFTDRGERWQVELHSHGSSTAFQDLAKGTADLGMSSRRIKPKEVQALTAQHGDLSAPGSEVVAGLDGLAVVVHRANPIASMTSETVARIFAGEVTDWSQLGNPPAPIELHARDDLSGTYDTFKSLVLEAHGRKLAASAKRYESSTELSDNVAASTSAIGFIGLPYVRNAKALGIAEAPGALAIVPTSFTVGTEDYPLSRRLYFYLPAKPATTELRDFVEFAHSSAGQEVVKEVGLVSQNIYAERPRLEPGLPTDYVQITRDAERLSLNFRFEPASYRLDTKGQRDLGRLIDFLETQPARTPLLLGFTDSFGDPAANVALSQERARAVEAQLQAHGVFPKVVAGFGPAIPVASNSTEAGRNKNRRVEVWVQ